MIGMPAATQPATTAEPALSDGQSAVVGAIKSGHNVLVTGSAGTGKSTLLKTIRSMRGLSVAASTGIAAVNVGGLTIHAWAGLGMGDAPAEQIIEKIRNSRYGKYASPVYDRIRNTRVLCIDEISMVPAKLLDLLDEVFKGVRQSDRPFGGIQMVFFGDFLQLPPVIKNPDEPRTHGTFAFQSKAWKAANVKVAMLTKVFRQADAAFSSALNDIRFGECTENAMAILRSRHLSNGVVDPNPEIRPVIIHTHNRAVDAINIEELDRIDAPEEKYVAADFGTNPGALKTLQQNCLAPEVLLLKVGAQVMLLANVATELGLANGSVGKVVKICSQTKIPTVKFSNGVEMMIQGHSWEIKSDGVVVATRSQIPLRLAYAITAHKSQGMTLDKIQCHLADVFADGQAYVTLSRVKTAEGLFIADGGRRCIRANPAAVRFYRECDKIANAA